MTPEVRNSLMTRTDIQIARGRLSRAQKILQEIVNEYPGDLEASFRLAEVLSALGKSKEAKELLEKNLAQAPWHSKSREYIHKIEVKERQAQLTPEMLPWPIRGVGAAALIVITLAVLAFVMYKNDEEPKPSIDTVYTCTVPGTEDAAADSGGSPAAATLAGTLTLGDLTVEVRTQQPSTPTPTPAPATGGTATPAPTAESAAIVSSTPVPTPQRFLNAGCTEDIATASTVTRKEAGGGFRDIPTGFLGVMAALAAVALLILLLPYIKTFEAGGVKIELRAPAGPSSTPPVRGNG